MWGHNGLRCPPLASAPGKDSRRPDGRALHRGARLASRELGHFGGAQAVLIVQTGQATPTPGGSVCRMGLGDLTERAAVLQALSGVRLT